MKLIPKNLVTRRESTRTTMAKKTNASSKTKTTTTKKHVITKKSIKKPNKSSQKHSDKIASLALDLQFNDVHSLMNNQTNMDIIPLVTTAQESLQEKQTNFINDKLKSDDTLLLFGNTTL